MSNDSTKTMAISRGDMVIGAVTVTILFGIFALLLHTLLGQIGTYQRMLAGHREGALELAFARAADAAIVKTCSIFLAFALMFLGALYTFRIAPAQYRLVAEGQKVKGTFETASPGLVMITLGMVLICAVVWKEYTITYDATTSVGSAGAKTVTQQAVEGGTERGFGRDEIASVNSAIAFVDGRNSVLTRSERETWSILRPRLDQLRRAMVFRVYPQMRQRYDSLAAKYSLDPGSISQLSAEERESFKSVQDLMSAQVNKEEQ